MITIDKPIGKQELGKAILLNHWNIKEIKKLKAFMDQKKMPSTYGLIVQADISQESRLAEDGYYRLTAFATDGHCAARIDLGLYKYEGLDHSLNCRFDPDSFEYLGDMGTRMSHFFNNTDNYSSSVDSDSFAINRQGATCWNRGNVVIKYSSNAAKDTTTMVNLGCKGNSTTIDIWVDLKILTKAVKYYEIKANPVVRLSPKDPAISPILIGSDVIIMPINPDGLN